MADRVEPAVDPGRREFADVQQVGDDRLDAGHEPWARLLTADERGHLVARYGKGVGDDPTHESGCAGYENTHGSGDGPHTQPRKQRSAVAPCELQTG